MNTIYVCIFLLPQAMYQMDNLFALSYLQIHLPVHSSYTYLFSNLYYLYISVPTYHVSMFDK